MKKISMLALFFTFLFVFAFVLYESANAQTTAKTATQKTTKTAIEEIFKKVFPGVPFDSIKPTDIKGVYEVSKGSEVIYFIPDPGYLFVGDIIGKEGKSLTEVRKGELVVEKAKNLPLEKAVKIGSGKNTIIEFTDPDCPYCRKASEFLEQKKDVTRYIFFFPLPMHPDAENKIKHIFCSEDKAKAYEDAMKGKFDDQKYEKCDKPEAAELLKLHKELAGKMGVNGTPFFIINGK